MGIFMFGQLVFLALCSIMTVQLFVNIISCTCLTSLWLSFIGLVSGSSYFWPVHGYQWFYQYMGTLLYSELKAITLSNHFMDIILFHQLDYFFCAF